FCYLVSCPATGEAAIIDPGGDEERLLKELQRRRLTLRYLINTHGHPDHTLGNARLKAATGAAIIMHRDDARWIATPEARAAFAYMGLPFSPPPDRTVIDGDMLPLGTLSLRVIHTPGHSPGSICLLAGGNLFTGDSLFVGAAGRVDLPGGSFPVLIDTLAAKIATLPDETVVWPGHDYGETPTSTVGREKQENPYLGGEW
ncbi:MAG: MBL fold metallo-hydrolase, partial [Desulfobulbaceae bacterium]|nr:MBL fold metallo-hydrolase [Desulfobulbaceae bacterium]